MTTLHTQNDDIFRDDDTGIVFDTSDESWTISSNVLVSSGALDGVFTAKANSVLDNNGTILSASEFEAGVTFDGDAGFILNAAGARIIGATVGILVGGHSETIENHGSITALSSDGVVFYLTSDNSVLTNDGAIFGRDEGVADISTDGGVIHNLGRIASGGSGIGINIPGGHTTTVTNASGATISGTDWAILVEGGGLFLDNHGRVNGDIVLASTADAATIVNHGTIDGLVFLGSGDDRFTGLGGTVAAVYGGSGNDTAIGGKHADLLFGDAGNDQLNGGAGSDTLSGGAGINTLTGGPGRDQFVFEATLDPLHNVERITDCAPNVDEIVLNDHIFLHLGHDGILAAAHFHVGTGAARASDNIIYNPANGFLFYDPDGRGGSGEIHFATLAPHLALHNTDFMVTHPFVEAA
jgi:Ca2+-binding RTX toxin-like protein